MITPKLCYLGQPLFLFIITMFSLVIGVANAEVWVSPIEKKYNTEYPELYKKYNKAKNILNSHSGYQKDLMIAEKLLAEILSKQSNFSPAYREYGRLYIKAGYLYNHEFRSGTLSSAETTILEAIRLEPNYADAYVLLGHLYTLRKDYPRAEKFLKIAEKIGTSLPWLHLNFADLLKYQGKRKQSLIRYMTVIDSDTNNKSAYSSALRSVAEHYQLEKNFKKADYWYHKLIEFDPTAWNLGGYSNYLLFWKGDADNSIEYGEKAIATMNYGIGRFNLACAYYTKWIQISATQGKKEAKQYFERAHNLYPNIEGIVNELSKYRATEKAAIFSRP